MKYLLFDVVMCCIDFIFKIDIFKVSKKFLYVNKYKIYKVIILFNLKEKCFIVYWFIS